MTVAFVDTWVPNGPFPIVESDDVRGGWKSFEFPSGAGNLKFAHIECVDEASITDGDTFILDDGNNPAVTFEFDKNGSVVETPTLRAVNLTGGETSEAVAQLIITAVNAAPASDMIATPAAGIGNVELQQDNFSNTTTIVQGGTSPLTTYGFFGEATGGFASVVAHNKVAPHNRVGTMMFAVTNQGSSEVYQSKWDESNGVFEDVPSVSVSSSQSSDFIEGAFDGPIAYFSQDKIAAYAGAGGSTPRIERTFSGNEVGLISTSNAVASDRAFARYRGRTSGNVATDIEIFAGNWAGNDFNGIDIDSANPQFTITDVANIEELFSVVVPTPSDLTESEFHFYAAEGGTPRGLTVNVDTGADLVAISQGALDAGLTIANLATTTNPVIISNESGGSLGTVNIETGTNFLRGSFGNTTPNEFSGAVFYDDDTEANQGSTIPVEGNSAALHAAITRNNSASALNADFGNMWLTNSGSNTGQFTQLVFSAGDEAGSYPHWHLFCELTVGGVDTLQDFGWALTDGLGGTYDGEKLLWFEGGNSHINIGGTAADEYSDLEQFEVRLTDGGSGATNTNVMRFNTGGGDGHFEVFSDNGANANTASFENSSTETINPGASAVCARFRVSGTDSLHNGGFLSFTGEIGATNDDAISTGVSGFIPDGTAAAELHSVDNFDALKVLVDGNVRWLRAYITRAP